MHNYFLLSDTEKDLQMMVREFMEKEVAPGLGEYDEKSYIPDEIVQMGIDMGLHCMNIPAEYGGMGLTAREMSIIREEIGKVDAGFSVTMGNNCLGVTPTMIFGTEEQKKYVADIVVPGGFNPFCLTEPQAGSDATAIRTTAKKDGDDYIINGRKCFITNGDRGDIYIVFAYTDKEKGINGGMSAFLVERNLPGVSVGKHENKMGLRTNSTCDVIFEDVRVPKRNLVGEEGKGYQIAMKTLERSRPLGSATSVGICQSVIDLCIKYANDRVVFGKPLAAKQAIKFMVADMEIQTQAARQMVMYASDLIDHGIYDGTTGSCVKAFCSDTAMKVTTDGVQIFGGYGYSKEYPMEKKMRDAKLFQIFEGTNQIQRVVISGSLFKRS
ncbi:acyl-CoA dehydrogenase family protein [Ventrimonas sp. CLA-AP-H27]|uniref:Acyl-CoA dehydrogenase family protein n=1 Tax=Ventrimonas faecis TaxID=3133170 RepID=A0ABV1HPA1_9FIRM